MLEAQVHQRLKKLLRQCGRPGWPHHLTLSRLVARSLRRQDVTAIHIAPGSDPSWMLSLLLPLWMGRHPVALVASQPLLMRLRRVELERLAHAGLGCPLWEGADCPAEVPIWLLDPVQLLRAWRSGGLGERQVVVLEAERFEQDLRSAMGCCLAAEAWEQLRRLLPHCTAELAYEHEQLRRAVFAHPVNPQARVALSDAEQAPLRRLLTLADPLPQPWRCWLESLSPGWVSWAETDRQLLRWTLCRQPLEPLALLPPLPGRGLILAGVPGPAQALLGALRHAKAVTVRLGDPPLQDPIPLFHPHHQPLPNSPVFADHLLDQCRRLMLGRAGLSVVLLDDDPLRQRLTSALAAEFGGRVCHQQPSPDGNGILCASWSWWLEHHARLPSPCQVVVAALPIASLEDPLTAARVRRWRLQGDDWFRSLLLPEALARLQRGVAPLRGQEDVRLALLDGRVRRRSWGQLVLDALQPTLPLRHLFPKQDIPRPGA